MALLSSGVRWKTQFIIHYHSLQALGSHCR